MLRAIPYPPPLRSTTNGDRMSGHHLHQPRAASSGPKPSPPPEQLITPAAVSRIYRAATNLFLTRRLPEALMTLQPIIAESVSPRVKCSRALRIKVWSLYFAILDTTAKMGPEEGKKVWGAQEWRRIVARVRSGAIWNEAIQAYGEEGRIDGDVVNTLVMLLLAHSQDQTIAQQKIEAYLSAAPGFLGPDDDPKVVSQRVKLMELYILHVLPRVGDWEYAREFTHMSPDLDEEQKDAFHTTLDALQKDSEEAEQYNREMEKRKEDEWQKERARIEQERAKRETSPSVSSRSPKRKESVNGRVRRSKAGSVRGDTPTDEKVKKRQGWSSSTESSISAANNAKNKNKASLFATTTALLNRLQSQMYTAHGRFTLLRTVIMLAVVVWMTSKRKVREKVRRLLMLAWIKMTRTVGMGMKVTYI